jgi:hypothetical protein
MPKRKLIWMCGTAFVLLAGALSALGAVVKHEPNFYRLSQVQPSPARKKLADDFRNKFIQMIANIHGREDLWNCDTSEVQVNCFFEELFPETGEATALRSIGISSPSVVFEPDRMRLAFRYGTGWFSTIISYDMKIWLVPKEANVIAVEIQSARAGGLPISNQSVLTSKISRSRCIAMRPTPWRSSICRGTSIPRPSSRRSSSIRTS